jgi:hypothetical protein
LIIQDRCRRVKDGEQLMLYANRNVLF